MQYMYVLWQVLGPTFPIASGGVGVGVGPGNVGVGKQPLQDECRQGLGHGLPGRDRDHLAIHCLQGGENRTVLPLSPDYLPTSSSSLPPTHTTPTSFPMVALHSQYSQLKHMYNVNYTCKMRSIYYTYNLRYIPPPIVVQYSMGDIMSHNLAPQGYKGKYGS